MKYPFFAIVIGGIILFACNSSNNKPSAPDKMGGVSGNEEISYTVSPFTSPVNGLLQIYLRMKNALVNDDDKKAAAAGNELVKALDNFDKTILRDEELTPFEDFAYDAKKHAKNIAMHAGNIKHQREHFSMLSKNMYDMVTRFAAGERIYVDYCPMFNNSNGALWLSEKIDIKNPYYGEAMLACGKVTETIQ